MRRGRRAADHAALELEDLRSRVRLIEGVVPDRPASPWLSPSAPARALTVETVQPDASGTSGEASATAGAAVRSTSAGSAGSDARGDGGPNVMTTVLEALVAHGNGTARRATASPPAPGALDEDVVPGGVGNGGGGGGGGGAGGPVVHPVPLSLSRPGGRSSKPRGPPSFRPGMFDGPKLDAYDDTGIAKFIAAYKHEVRLGGTGRGGGVQGLRGGCW
jgi:hypothetical protein